jgi:hypothetical protein
MIQTWLLQRYLIKKRKKYDYIHICSEMSCLGFSVIAICKGSKSHPLDGIDALASLRLVGT